MLRGMTIRQFQEWRDYADLEPFDEWRADLRAASIVQTLININRRKGTRAVSLQDCVVRFGTAAATAAPPSPEGARKQVRRTMDVLMAIFNQPEPKKKAAKR